MLSIDEFDFHLDLYTLQQRDFVTNLLQRECPSGWHLLYFDGIPDSNKHGSIGGPKFVLKDGYEPTPLILVVLAQSLYRKLHGYYLCNSKLVCKENLNDTRFALYSETPPEKLRICSVDYESTINLSAMLTK